MMHWERRLNSAGIFKDLPEVQTVIRSDWVANGRPCWRLSM